jgi:hypothetical protein
MQAAQAMLSMKLSLKNCFAFLMRFARVENDVFSKRSDHDAYF